MYEPLIALYRGLCRAPHSSSLIPLHVLKIMSHVPQSLEEQRDSPSVNSPLTVSSGLIFSSALARKRWDECFKNLFQWYLRERKYFIT